MFLGGRGGGGANRQTFAGYVSRARPAKLARRTKERRCHTFRLGDGCREKRKFFYFTKQTVSDANADLRNPIAGFYNNFKRKPLITDSAVPIKNPQSPKRHYAYPIRCLTRRFCHLARLRCS